MINSYDMNESKFKVSIFYGLIGIKNAWHAVTKATNQNCYSHVGFSKNELKNVVPNDAIFLACIMQYFTESLTFSQYLTVDNDLETTLNQKKLLLLKKIQ